MRRIAPIGLVLALLACPASAQTPLDARTAAVAACGSKPVSTYVAHVECLLSADRAFYSQAGFSNLAMWEDYSSRMRRAAAEADADRLSQDAFALQILAIKARYHTPSK